MLSREAIDARLHEAGIKGQCWGCRGLASLTRIESVLSLTLPVELMQFAIAVGNANIGPYAFILSGHEDQTISCVTETAAIRQFVDETLGPVLKILDHAGESYLYVFDADSIKAYDSLNMSAGLETSEFTSLAQLLDFAFDEAAALTTNDWRNAVGHASPRT